MSLYFKENFKKLREERKIKQSKLAEILHVSPQSVSHWETGYTEPSQIQLVAIAKYFDVTVDDLLCEKL